MLKKTVLLAFIAILPTAASAHGVPPPPSHGGKVVEDSAEHWVECAITGDQITFYVLDENRAPIPSARLAGKATILIGNKAQHVTLLPGAANSLAGKLSGPAPAHITAVLSLTVDGTPGQARVVLP